MRHVISKSTLLGINIVSAGVTPHDGKEEGDITHKGQRVIGLELLKSRTCEIGVRLFL